MLLDTRVLEVDPIHRRIVLSVVNIPEEQPPRPETPSKIHTEEGDAVEIPMDIPMDIRRRPNLAMTDAPATIRRGGRISLIPEISSLRSSISLMLPYLNM